MLKDIDYDLNALIVKLTDMYPLQQENIRQIPILISKLEKKEDISETLEELQEINNKLYNEKSTEENIELQVLINNYRYEFDITDPREIIHYDNGKGYVQ